MVQGIGLVPPRADNIGVTWYALRCGRVGETFFHLGVRIAGMGTPATNPLGVNTCAKCGATLVPNQPFCSTCGTLNGAPPSLAAMQTYVDAQIASQLAAKLKDQASVVRELADDAEDVVWKRFKRYSIISGFFLVVIFGLVTFIGFKTYADLKASVVEQVKPAVKALQDNVNALNATVDDLNKKRIPAVTQSLNVVEGEAQAQKKRVSDADGKIAKSMASLNAAEQKANADSAAFSKSAQDNQRKLDQLTQRSTEQINQVTASASKTAIAQAYGFMAEDPAMTVGGQTISKKNKKPGEKWVNLVVSLDAIQRQTYTTAQLEKVESALLGAGYRVFIGVSSVGGHFGYGFYRLSYPDGDSDSEIIYFDKEKKTEAEQLQVLVNRELPNRCGVKLAADVIKGSYQSEAVRYFDDNSGMDAQVYLGSVPGK